MKTDAFELPSGISCEIREFDGKTEKMLTDKALIKQGRMTDMIIARSLVSLDGEEIKDESAGEAAALNMLTGDRNFLLLKIRVLNYGPKMLVNHCCPYCGEWAGYDLDLEEILADEDEESLKIRPYGANVTVELSTGDKVELAEPTGHVERRIAQMKDATLLDYDMGDVVSVNGQKAKRSFFNDLPARDLQLIRETANEKLHGGLSSHVYLSCNNCDAENDVVIFRNPDFFFPGRTSSGKRSQS